MAMAVGALSPSLLVIRLFDSAVFLSLRDMSNSADLQRCGKSCRLRWINYLRPDLKRGTFSQQEEKLIIELHAAVGNR